MVGVRVDGTTRLMGIIGDPISQARTPQAINPIFAAKGADIVCVPLHVPADDLATVWAGLKAMPNLIGFGVTLPHKQTVPQLCDSLDPLAARIGAVNVVRRESDGSFRGYQFDGQGFVRGLIAQGVVLQGRDALMIGAGGAAVAIAFALQQAGVARLVVANRTFDKAEALARAVNEATGTSFATASAPTPVPGQLVVNATSLGLNNSDPLPLDVSMLQAGMTVAEVIAKPEITALLRAAEQRGAAIHSGIHMITGQVSLIADHMIAALG